MQKKNFFLDDLTENFPLSISEYTLFSHNFIVFIMVKIF